MPIGNDIEIGINLSLDEVSLTLGVKTTRKTLLPEMLFLGFSYRIHNFKCKSSIGA
jgi:hypothetical protein